MLWKTTRQLHSNKSNGVAKCMKKNERFVCKRRIHQIGLSVWGFKKEKKQQQSSSTSAQNTSIAYRFESQPNACVYSTLKGTKKKHQPAQNTENTKEVRRNKKWRIAFSPARNSFVVCLVFRLVLAIEMYGIT